MTFKSLLAILVLGAASLGASLPAQAGAPIATGAAAIPPAGFLGFCVRHLKDCMGRSEHPAALELTDERRRELDSVQAKINAAITPREDPAHVWDYSTDGYGDCNKFALTKRKELIGLGWPRETLLLATAFTEGGEGHLVLVAHTTQGDLVLDNRLAPVVDWTALPYRWVSIQSPRSPVQWVSIVTHPFNLNVADARAPLGSPSSGKP